MISEARWLCSDEPREMLGSSKAFGWVTETYKPSDRKLRLWIEACRAACDGHEGNNPSLRWLDPAKQNDLHECIVMWSVGGFDVPMRTRANLLREIVGNPFSPVVVAPEWRTPDVVSLSKDAFEIAPVGGCMDPLTIMAVADALEEAGCQGRFHECDQCDDAGMFSEGFQVSIKCPICDGTKKVFVEHPLLWHLRSCKQSPHVRGCWVIDSLLGLE